MTLNNDLLDSEIKTNADVKDFDYPLQFEFKIGTLANDFIAKDTNGRTLAYVRQKMFKLKEAVTVYADDTKSTELFKINADRWLDYNASYSLNMASGAELGRMGRRGRKSILKAHYDIFDKNDDAEFTIQEENPWTKLWDAFLCEIPVLSLFSGYLFNPRYIVKRTDGTEVIRLSKERSFFGRRFKVTKLSDLSAEEGERVMLSLMMMSLLERRRG